MTVEMSEYLPRGPDMAKGISTMILCRIWKAETGSCLLLNDGQTKRWNVICDKRGHDSKVE